jgi:hypothetical protein
MTTTSSSLARASRLPRDLALVTVAVDAAMVLFNLALQLWPGTPEAEQMRSTYAMPRVWIFIASGIGMAWMLAAALAWSHGRQALERRGAEGVALLPGPRVRHGAVYLVVLVLNFYVLNPLLSELQLLFMPGGQLQEYVGTPGIHVVMAMSTVAQAVVQLAVLVLGVWLAAWVALRPGADAPAVEPLDEADAQAGASPRRAVALVGAAVFASLQVWSTTVASHWTDAVRLMDSAALLLGWIVLPLVVFALAFWGGWLGAGSGLAQVRPFRAVAASVWAFVQVQAICIVTGIAWLMLAIRFSSILGSVGGLIAFVAAFLLLYMALTMLLMRATMRRKYRPSSYL